MSRLRSSLVIALVSSTVTAGAIVGTAAALAPRQASTTFYACENDATKAVSQITGSSALSCTTGFTKVSWTSGSLVGTAYSPDQIATLDWSGARFVYGESFSGGSYGFRAPQAIAFDGAHIWVANNQGNSMTELNATGGSLVRTVTNTTCKSCGFSRPQGVAFDGAHLWIANVAGGSDGKGSITELNAVNGVFVRKITNASCPSCGFGGPEAIAFDGSHLWIANEVGGFDGKGSVTELSAANGAFVRTITNASCPTCGLSATEGVAFDGSVIWVTNYQGNSATELDAANGALVRTVTNSSCPSCGFNHPWAIAFDGLDVWIANNGGKSVTELVATNGSFIRTITDTSCPGCAFNGPGGLAYDGSHLWVANYSGNSVTELDAANGALVRNITNASCTSCAFVQPWAIAFDGTSIWVANYGNSVTELSTL